MAANIYDIAKKTGLSTVTVSRVLNNYPNVREANRKKVLDAIAELDYTPSPAARTLARGKAHTAGLILPEFSDVFMWKVMAAAERTLKKHGYFLTVAAATSADELDQINAPLHFIGDRVDGVLMLTPAGKHPILQHICEREIPLVLLDQHYEGSGIPSVCVDNEQGGYAATQALICGGARRVAHIAGSRVFQSSLQRERGYLRAMAEHGLPIDSSLLVQGDFSVQSGCAAMRRWLEDDTMPDAVFAADDQIALGVLDTARQAGIAVPGQLAVIGFDNHPLGGALHPMLSTMDQPADEIGRHGALQLLALMAGKQASVTPSLFSPTLILRDTTINL